MVTTYWNPATLSFGSTLSSDIPAGAQIVAVTRAFSADEIGEWQ